MSQTKEKRTRNRTIPSRTGRLWLMGVVVAFLVAALAYLFWIGRDGGINPELKTQATLELLGFYMPVLSLMAAFYFGGRQSNRGDKATPFDTFVVALVFTTLWTFAPIPLLKYGGAIEEILATLNKIKPFGDTLALAAIGYYFSKN